jgi:hypothetical protein
LADILEATRDNQQGLRNNKPFIKGNGFTRNTSWIRGAEEADLRREGGHSSKIPPQNLTQSSAEITKSNVDREEVSMRTEKSRGDGMAQPDGDVAEVAAMKAILMAMIGTQAASLGSKGAQHFLDATRAAALEGIRTGSFTSAEGPVDFEAVRVIRERTLQSINEVFDRIHIEF